MLGNKILSLEKMERASRNKAAKTILDTAEKINPAVSKYVNQTINDVLKVADQIEDTKVIGQIPLFRYAANMKYRFPGKAEKIKKLQQELNVIEEIYPKLKKELDEIQNNLNKLNLEKNGFDISKKHVGDLIIKLDEEIKNKLIIRDKKEQINKIQFWLTEKFVPMMDAMEKNILYSVHSEFNSLFERWFSVLIENNVLQMCLDEEYSPKIIQNGYDIDYEYLSGGEKTAGALAYRLALNQVINNLNTGIKTKDLLILDEPTDGFSSEQLERLKILMEEIKIPQIIIVSHEAQIESFVDHIIRFEKHNHQTRVY